MRAPNYAIQCDDGGTYAETLHEAFLIADEWKEMGLKNVLVWHNWPPYTVVSPQ